MFPNGPHPNFRPEYDELAPVIDMERWRPLAEVHQLPVPDGEEYGLSLSSHREVGKIAVRAVMHSDPEALQSPEVDGMRKSYLSALGETLKTPLAAGEHVRIEYRNSFEVVDGEPVTETGTRLHVLISNGAITSYQTAEKQDCQKKRQGWNLQGKRDEADLALLVEDIVPMLKPDCDHNTVFAVSAYPEDMVRFYGSFAQERGYNVDFECAMLQGYHRDEDGRLQTRVLSIDKSNVGALADLLRRHGANIPEGISPHELITYVIKMQMTKQEADAWMDAFADEYEASQGLAPKRATTLQVLADQPELCERTFQEMYLPIAASLALGTKTAEVFDLAAMAETVADAMDDYNRRAVQSVYLEEDFTDAHARTMHGVVLYTAGKMLCDYLKESDAFEQRVPLADISPVLYRPPEIVLFDSTSAFIEQAGSHFQRGVRRGESMGNCGALFKFGDSTVRQREFGDADSHESSLGTDPLDAGDGKGALWFKCLKGHLCRRPFGRLLLECRRCNDGGKSIRC